MTTTTLDPDLLDRAACRYHDLGGPAGPTPRSSATWPTGVRRPAWPIRPTRSCSTRRSSSWPAPRCSPRCAPDRREQARDADRGDRHRVRGVRRGRCRSRPRRTSRRSRPAQRRLVAAIDRGELDDVDQAARWLGRAATGPELQSLLAADIVTRLAAAAHAPIFLFQLPRIAPRGEVTGELLRGLARELGRYAGVAAALDGRPGARARGRCDRDVRRDRLDAARTPGARRVRRSSIP